MARTRPFMMIPLSNLVASRRNVRRVQPDSEAHDRLVATIRAHNLLQPLVVRPSDDEKKFSVIDGHRRLAALREIHKDNDWHVPCMLREVEDGEAGALSLTANFAREPMHPLDEAEEFARLAGKEGKYAEAIAADFGVKPLYVKQRMKLATLDPTIKTAYRDGQIDTATAEAFASVPPNRQTEVWQEVNGKPRHADHVHNIIAHNWIDAAHALFDVGKLPDSVVTRDLFSEKVLVERQAFLETQSQALEAQRKELQEDGWTDVQVGSQTDVQDRLYAMDKPELQYDEMVTLALGKLHERYEKWQGKLEGLEEGDEARAESIQAKMETLEQEAAALVKDAVVHYSKETKALGTAFLILDPDGRVRREFRVPRKRQRSQQAGVDDGMPPEKPAVSTSDDLKDGQLAATFHVEALMVRQAVLEDSLVCKRILVLALHEKIRKDAIAIRSDANATTLYAQNTESLSLLALEEFHATLKKRDLFADASYVEELEAYEKVSKHSESRLDELIAILTVQILSAHSLHRAELVHRLAQELKINVRSQWRPAGAWLESFQKIQLMHLLKELRGPVYDPITDHRKKSELVDALAKLFADAADGKLEDEKLSQRVNAWLPSSLRD